MMASRRRSSQAGETSLLTARQSKPPSSKSGEIVSADQPMLASATSQPPSNWHSGESWKLRSTATLPNQKTNAEIPIAARAASNGGTPSASIGAITQLNSGPQ